MFRDIRFSVDAMGIIHTFISNEERNYSHLIPVLNDNKLFCNIIGVYSKDGWITSEEEQFISEFSDVFRFVFFTASGPYYEKHYKKLYKSYAGVMGLNTCNRVLIGKYNNNLELNYSMMARSGPEMDGFYYMNEKNNIDMDFSVLTWYGDRHAKVWKDAYKTIVRLCAEGYKGILINQRGDNEKIINDKKLKKFIDDGRLEVYGMLDQRMFHDITCRARVGIFPNRSDAFPKHIIECLLQDKPIVVSPKLLFGVDTLRELGEEIVLVQDFSEKDYLEKIMSFIDKRRNDKEISPRQEWIDRYEFDKLCIIWAAEFKRVLGEDVSEKIMCMRHLPRFYHETLDISVNNIV